MTDTALVKPTLKQYKGNSIQHVLYKKAVETTDPEKYMSAKRTEMKQALNLSKRLTAIINNVYAPSIEELVIIASVLDVTLDELVIME